MVGTQGEQWAAQWGMPEQRPSPNDKPARKGMDPPGRGLARSPSPASRSLPDGGSARTEAGAALPGASYRRAGGRWRVVVTSIIAGLLS